MSALNAYNLDNCAAIVTDTAAYDDQGVVWRFVPKAIALPHLKTIVATRGPVWAAPAMAIEVGMFASFDAIVRGIEEHLPTFLEKHAEQFHEEMPAVQLMIAGWSDERDRAEIYQILSPGASMTDADALLAGDTVTMNPGTLYPIDSHSWISPNIPPEIFAASGLELAEGQTTEFKQAAAATLELQRNHHARLKPGAPIIAGIGGTGIAHSVTREGVFQEVLCRWPDHLGSPIDRTPTDWAAWREANGWPVPVKARVNAA